MYSSTDQGLASGVRFVLGVPDQDRSGVVLLKAV
jgi:hypothetical protein